MKKQFKLVRMGVMYRLAQLGTTKGRSITLQFLLSLDQLPGSGWSIERDVFLRAGVIRPISKQESRARKVGSVWAIRSFFSVSTSRWLVTRLLPLASENDVLPWIAAWQDRLTNRDSMFYLTESTMVTGVQLPEFGVTHGVESVLAPIKSHPSRVVKEVAGHVGNVVFVMRCMSLSDEWSWDDVLSLASLQGTRILNEVNKAH
ncbi:MAG: hypothetical protein ABSE75_13880 [Acidimicrobiales bacterium]|jgi:hypothetical protein